MPDASSTTIPEDWLSGRLPMIPRRPGVYLFRDRRNKVLYVGKAKNLRARLRSYVTSSDGRYQVRFLMQRAAGVETLVTATETEALILESNLIKQYRPRYNIRLKDDKTYLSVKVTTKDAWPRVFATRHIVRDGNTYLGPYASATGLRETLETIRRVFPLRTCSDAVFRNRSRPCLEYQIRRCLGPCVLKVDVTEYRRQVDAAVQLLEGKTSQLLSALTAQMKEAAEKERFEDAARLRDRIAAIAKIAEKQAVVSHGGGDRDVFALCREAGVVEVQVLVVRAGKLVGHHGYHFEDHELPDEELLSSMTARFYEGERFIPDEVLLPARMEGIPALAEYLGDKRGRRVAVLVPRRGERRRLVEMAVENARQGLRERLDDSVRREATLSDLQHRLGLASIPKRIECFDISHVQGDAVVASMVAFDEGLPDRSGYRRYKLRGVQRNDDFAAMREVIGRRLARGKGDGGLPDLMLVDGGRGQLAMALEAARELEIEGVEFAAIAKERIVGSGEDVEKVVDRVFRPGRSNPVTFKAHSGALHLLACIRDEAHRCAITFHRELRSKQRLRSCLDDIPGIGPARRKALLTRFGSVAGVRRASVNELVRVAGISEALAARILELLGGEIATDGN